MRRRAALAHTAPALNPPPLCLRYGVVNRANDYKNTAMVRQYKPENDAGVVTQEFVKVPTILDTDGYMLPNQANRVTRQVCPAPKEKVVPLEIEMQVDFVLNTPL